MRDRSKPPKNSRRIKRQKTTNNMLSKLNANLSNAYHEANNLLAPGCKLKIKNSCDSFILQISTIDQESS